MRTLSGIAALVSRRRRMQAYLQARREAEAMSDEMLADIGMKRYQLGHVARVKALG
jgi:uncharacterized protein YjiS (DUF1127 family)